MRFGTWRGVAPLLAFALAAVYATGGFAPAQARAGIICHTIPREVVAVDINTGGPYFAPPVPGGCYTKDPVGAVYDAFGAALGLLSGCWPGCGHCGGAGCGHCGGAGCGHCGHGSPSGHDPCAVCGGNDKGCGFCGWRGLLHGHGGKALGAGCGGGLCSPQRAGKACSLAGHASTVCPSVQAAPQVSPLSLLASAQGLCSKAGCKLKMRHFHRIGKGCTACNGQGCGLCHGGLLSGKVCDDCHGAGCGHCGGTGLCHPGLGAGGLGAGGLCSQLLGVPAGLIGKLFHIGEIEYFMGPGGPVPLTPGYVPYVVSTRSPRDYFAFPPFSDVDP
jgi:hypothetical protein